MKVVTDPIVLHEKIVKLHDEKIQLMEENTRLLKDKIALLELLKKEHQRPARRHSLIERPDVCNACEIVFDMMREGTWSA